MVAKPFSSSGICAAIGCEELSIVALDCGLASCTEDELVIKLCERGNVSPELSKLVEDVCKSALSEDSGLETSEFEDCSPASCAEE